MRKSRTPRNFEGTQTTTHRLSTLLPEVLQKVQASQGGRPDLILAAWPDIVGPSLSKMCTAISFSEGILLVKVKNSTLLSVFSQHEKKRLLQTLKERFPKININDIRFRMG